METRLMKKGEETMSGHGWVEVFGIEVDCEGLGDTYHDLMEVVFLNGEALNADGDFLKVKAESARGYEKARFWVGDEPPTAQMMKEAAWNV